MNQTRLISATETTSNIASGFIISYFVWLFLVPPLFGSDVSAQDPSVAFWLTSLFTITSWLRSYFWRRFFNNGLHSALLKLIKR